VIADFTAALQLQALELPARQQLVATVLAVAMLALVLELVRRRKLREEYSWGWIGTSLLLLVLAWRTSLLTTLSDWIGAVNSTSTLLFFGVLFLMLLALQFSVRLSRLTHRHKTLGQRVGLLEAELHELRARLGGANSSTDGAPVLPLRTLPERKLGDERKQDEA